MPYAVVVVSMARVGGPTVALKRLATDQAGYFAFDLTGVLAKQNLAEISLTVGRRAPSARIPAARAR